MTGLDLNTVLNDFDSDTASVHSSPARLNGNRIKNEDGGRISPWIEIRLKKGNVVLQKKSHIDPHEN